RVQPDGVAHLEPEPRVSAGPAPRRRGRRAPAAFEWKEPQTVGRRHDPARDRNARVAVGRPEPPLRRGSASPLQRRRPQRGGNDGNRLLAGKVGLHVGLLTRGGAVRGAAIAMAAMALWGCDLFTPATPEPPSGGGGFAPNYNSVDACLATLGRAIEVRD